jgi:Zn-dependent protease
MSRMAVLPIVLVVVIWLLGSFWLLTYCHQNLSAGGIAFFVGGAFVVFIFMVLELIGLQKIVSVGSPRQP